MYLSREEMIYQVASSFINDEYKKAIGKRLFNSFAITPLNPKNCKGLNKIVNYFNNPMLSEVYFEWTMSEKVFDNYISRLLYVSGRWIELCFYNFLIMNDIKNDIVNIDYSTVFTTTIYAYFRYDSKMVKMCVDDEKIGIKIETITIQEREF